MPRRGRTARRESAPVRVGEDDVADAATEVQARALDEGVDLAVGGHGAGAADVDDADLAVLEEVLAADLGVARQGELDARRHRAAEHDAIVVRVA